MADPNALQADAASFAHQAVEYDKNGMYGTAIFFYVEAAHAIEQLIKSTPSHVSDTLASQAEQYISRAEALRRVSVSVDSSVKSKQEKNTEKAKFLFEQALEEDENDNTDAAVEQYMEAADLALKMTDCDESYKAKMKKLASQAIERVEALKSVKPVVQQSVKPRPLGNALQEPLKTRSGTSLSREEVDVLRITSIINGREYVPFMSIDMKERFAFPLAYSDKCGTLALSPKQRNEFDRWVRPDEIMSAPKMIFAISSYSIKQTLISDCSFVASLAISAQYERRFSKQLITSIIYPQNKQGQPVYNPCGKYMIKLNINGIARKVIIDDLLPVSRTGQLLCSYSSNRNELWVSLMEKAYMKVMGGYDFPGSNSNIDMHALTGWIPERVSMSSTDFQADKEFTRLHDRFHKGHCLITVATGDISEEAADRAGLVPTHAYALLDLQYVKGYKLVMLKNPWSHLRWKGNFSEYDCTHWTEDMQKSLNYDPKMAESYDNGVFWIDLESLVKFFDVLYINWNPALFAHTSCFHSTWKAREGPRKDSYNMGDNPQYRLDVKGSGAVWVLLTRHITDKVDFANNQEFITILVYKSQGKRVYHSYDPAPYVNGVRINSPHYLCKMVEDSPGVLTLVLSQYEKNNTIHFTLRVFASCPVALAKIVDPYVAKHEKQETGLWSASSAGGCRNYPDTYPNNPLYQVSFDAPFSQVLIELKAPKTYSIGFEVVCVSEKAITCPSSFKMKSSGVYRSGFSVLELEQVPAGLYNIIPCTFKPGLEGNFFLKVNSSSQFSLRRIK